MAITIGTQLGSHQITALLGRGGMGEYLASGHIVYIHDGTLFTVPFDLNRLEVAGQPVPAIEGVSAQPYTGGAAQFAAVECRYAGISARRGFRRRRAGAMDDS